MSAASIDGPRLKLNRAGKHLKDLERVVGRFIRAETDRVTIEDDAKSDERLWVLHQPQQPDPALGPFIGDFLYNCRSALDHLAWQLVLANGRNPNTTGAGFPMLTSQLVVEIRGGLFGWKSP